MSKSSGRDTLKALRKDVETIETRLKQANTLTHNNVQSLETAFTVLERRIGETTDTRYNALKSYIQQVSEQLREHNVQTRNSVRESLKTALEAGDNTTVSSTLETVQAKLDNAEIERSESFRKVNRHIADLALAVDKRIKAESQSRLTALKAVAEKVDIGLAKTHVKIDKIENATADAIRTLGDKVGHMTDEIHSKTARSAAALQQKLIEREDATRNNFKTLQSRLERRLESLEEAQRNLDSYTDRTVANLTARIDSLEYGLSSEFTPVSHGGGNESVPANIPSDIDDAFSPEPYPPTESASVDPNLIELQAHAAEAAAQSFSPGEEPVIEEFSPVEFVPEAPAPTYQGQFAYHNPQKESATASPYDNQAPVPFAEPVYAEQPSQFEPVAPFQAPQTNPYASEFPSENNFPVDNHFDNQLDSNQVVTPFPGAQPISDDDLPYDNPAYAETDTEKRPGGFGVKDVSALSILGNKNLRVAGFAIAAVAVGAFALKGVLPTFGTAPTGQGDSANTQVVHQNELSPSVEMDAPLGNYADNTAIDLQALGATELNDIESAANAGNAVAQYQLGLSYLEQGRIEDGVNLVRASANQDQPAAQYRLAKLYETGTGVTQDADMARQLTERSARNGNRIAMHELALYYAEGRGGVTANIKTAAQWFEKAAQRGVVDSQFNLGVLFESGQGLPKNITDAFVWYSVAAKQGDQFAQDRVGILKNQLDATQLQSATNRIETFKPIPIDEGANGIFKNMPWTATVAKKSGPDPDMIREVQELLSDLGYDVGRPDGAMGPRTRSAIISFQQLKGMEQTGQIDTGLIDELASAKRA